MARPGGYRRPFGTSSSTPTTAQPARRQHFDKPPLVAQVTTLWDYPSQHYGDEEQGDKSYKGATPSYVIWNVVHRYTKGGETVLDPFCGSGTTLDVCRDLDRKGVGFDLAPMRADVKQADARSVPLRSKTVDLVFMDPPYADNLDYSDDARCIGKLKANGQGVAFKGTDAAGPNVFSKGAGDFKIDSEKKATLTVKYVAASAGNVTINGTYKMSVCSKDSCQLETQELSVTVAVK